MPLRPLATISFLLLAAALLIGCGGGDEPSSEVLGLKKEAPLDPGVYEQRMRGVSRTLASAQAKFEQGVRKADALKLDSAALQWEQAVVALEKITPPSDVQPAHRDLVTSMHALSGWNRLVADAASKGPKATAKVANEAADSTDVTRYVNALAAIEEAGYFISADM